MKNERGVNVNKRYVGDDDNRLPNEESRILALSEMMKISGENLVFWRWVAGAGLLVFFGVFSGSLGFHCSGGCQFPFLQREEQWILRIVGNGIVEEMKNLRNALLCPFQISLYLLRILEAFSQSGS